MDTTEQPSKQVSPHGVIICKHKFPNRSLLSTNLSGSQELWKEIPGHHGYFISSHGRILSPRKILKPWKGRKGYLSIRLPNGKNFTIHRLVARLFIENPEGFPMVCHFDGSRDNNTVHNLYWGSGKDNTADALRHGTHPTGEAHPLSKLSDNDVEAIRLIGRRKPISKTAEYFGVCEGHISKILNERSRIPSLIN